jgi:hypothetical protein
MRQEGSLKRAFRNIAVAGSAAALMAVAAPAAQAGPENASDCTTTYLFTLGAPSAPDFVTYTPPADVTVHGNEVARFASFVAGATWTYVDCVV